MWSAIWKVEVWPKIKAFIWKVATKSLSTRATLARRGVTLSALCPCCLVDETVEHVLFGCPWVRQVWLTHLPVSAVEMARNSLDDWLMWATTGNLSRRPDAAKSWPRLMIVCWVIWKSRCKLVFEGRIYFAGDRETMPRDDPATHHQFEAANNYSMVATTGKCHQAQL